MKRILALTLGLAALMLVACDSAGLHSPVSHVVVGNYTGTFDITAGSSYVSPRPTPYDHYTIPTPNPDGSLTIMFTVAPDGKQISRLSYWAFSECAGEGAPVEVDAIGVPIADDGTFSYKDAYQILKGHLASNGTASGSLGGIQSYGRCGEQTGNWNAARSA